MAQQVDFSKPTYYFDNLTVNEGLSQSSVLSIYQDRLGFMWLGTRDGLNRYDGYQFKIFRNQVGDSTSISENIIKDIKEDARGNIWIATEKGISKYDTGQDSFENYPIIIPLYPNPTVDVIHISKDQRIWVGGNFGLLSFNVEEGGFSKDFLSQYDEHPTRKYSVSSILEEADGNLLIGSSKKGVLRWNPFEKKLSFLHDHKTSKFKIKRVQAIDVKDGFIWVGTYGNGLFKLDAAGNILTHYHTKAEKPELRTSNDFIRTLQFDGDYLWIGTFKGLNVIKGQEQITVINYRKGDPKGLSHSSVRSLFKDQKGSIWIGTYFGGVSIYDIHNQRFKHYYTINGNETSLSYNVIGAFEEDAQHLFIGTERGGLNIYDTKSNIHGAVADPVLSKSIVKSLCKDPDNVLWAGIFKKGLHRFDSKKKTLLPYPDGNSPFNHLKKAIINCIVPYGNEYLWIGTDEKGLQKFNYRKKKFTEYPYKEEVDSLIEKKPIKAIVVNGDDLYLATKGLGIVHFNPKSGIFEKITKFQLHNAVLELTEFNHLSIDPQGIFWLSTNGNGIVSYDPRSKECKRWHTGTGLGSNIVLGTLHDENTKSTWVINRNGLSVIDKDENHVLKNYSYTSGFPLEEMNEGAFFKTDSGAFLIGGSNGYTKFHPNELSTNTYGPKPVLTSLNLFNKAVKPNDNNNILNEEISKTSQVTFDYFQSVFSLEFASLNYLRPEENQYAYMLEGFNEDWIYGGTRKEVTYTNLPSGTYTFLVKSANNDGHWNETPTSLAITILPPPWQTWWAYTIYGLLIALTFYLIRYNAIKSTQLKNDLRIEQLEKEKWKEVHDLKLKYFIDVSHEFRTPLALILGPLEEMIGVKNQDKWLNSRIKMMYFNAKRLKLLINQILEIREIETGHSKLKKEPIYLGTILRDIVDSFKGIADKNQIKLSLDFGHTPEKPLAGDKDKLEKIFFNLLSNAFKFTSEGGEIAVKVAAEETDNGIVYEFGISDSGIGIPPDKLPKIFDRFYKVQRNQLGAGIGLSLTKSLVNIMLGTIDVKSVEGEGTTFLLRIPFKTAGSSLENAPYSFVKPIPLEYQDMAVVSRSKADTVQGKETILLVEDNTEFRNYLKEQLEDHYTIFTAKDGLSGLKKAKSKAPDIIISDVMMPEMDGLDLCEQIKKTKELCHIPVILLTARNSQIHKIEGLEHGADDYIAKPFDFTELITRIKNIIGNRNLIRQKFKEGAFRANFNEIKINSYDEKLMKNIFEIIEAQFDRPNFTVDFLSSEVGLSRVHLTRKLKALTGMAPAEFLKDFRMKKAVGMLRMGTFKIADIAYSVGYQDVQYFSKAFKAKYGKSPLLYIKENSSANIQKHS